MTRETSVDVPARPKSTLGVSPSGSTQLTGSLTSPKPSPDRYRNASRPQVDPSNNSGPSRIQAASASASPSGSERGGKVPKHSDQCHPMLTMVAPTVFHPPGLRDPPVNILEHGLVTGVAVAGPMHAHSISKQDVKLVNVPPRSDASKRLTNPSPLSRPSTTNDASSQPTPAPQESQNLGLSQSAQPKQESPAAQQLAAINKDAKKKSKLRRAFSFGSANQLRRASAYNNSDQNVITDQISKRNSKFEDEMDPEQAKIAQKQEAGGLGESIYSGQGNFFTGSTDNLSIQSSASSASVMLRKMGKGVKKSTRSIVGIFRPKSVIGVPAADGPAAGTAQVSMVTVEAEREKVNINLNPHDQVGGGTGFPKLERNSIDAGTSVDTGRLSNDTRSRRSIVGGEKERAEVLAAVKKGILKRNDSSQSSPATTPRAYRVPEFSLPQIPRVNDSPNSSEPSTPSDGAPPRSGHRRTDSVTIEGSDSDYFSSITQFAALDAPGAPMTPQSSLVRNISFSPRIQFYDTWPSMEYDRRGDIATCNRLTPMLAQQIKEELNTFKMEMEVHESSKVYTHFF
ncbi:hypothetical protein EPUS_02804 [Endocarpon pusillum Z07020]|uniref:Protein BNI4 n=1 Tax=Endocarpon pusillum (strain Z07020 / HMAS-L-300199) TaxID=1263415 RepID=U1GK15_ENDPU|nr:uncharacterized protein EPUS_02804 [Endocarpon pusillum Z07020]ERF72523.1 hypothetical protein EPUS_02804 [Endocarpon pusillum Z07020]